MSFPPRRLPPVPGTILVLLLVGVATAAATDGAPAPRRLFDTSYRMDVSIPFHVGLFHWVDSLAGTSGGKTVPAHRNEFALRFGNIDSVDEVRLQRFRDARQRDQRRVVGGAARGNAALRRTFIEAPDLDGALARARGEMAPEDFSALRDALLQFREKYAAVWEGGSVPEDFMRRVAKNPGGRKLEALLADIADSFGVDVETLPTPGLVLVPVPSGYGTHATAVGRHLLIEVRPEDSLADQASVIVHENAHFLFYRMDASMRRRIENGIASDSRRTKSAWRALNEALPTALGQGVADRLFRPRAWSRRRPWYHTSEVDAYAKAIYPLVSKTLEEDGRFDEAFFKQALELYTF